VVDPHEPPMPPKVTAEQAEKLAKALAKGTANRKEIMLTIASDKVRELVYRPADRLVLESATIDPTID
jgi:pyruvate dehydrogenase (quinone)